jgi:hypothetical protein
MVPSLFREDDLQRVWERQLFRRGRLLTEEAIPLVVEFPGVRSGEGGPDFRGARLVLGGRRVIGDVELHLSPSGWRAHGHDRDGAYAGVVLHVVLRRDPATAARPCPVPLLVLEPYLAAVPEPSRPVVSPADLDAWGEAWFAERRARIRRALERRPPDEVLYREILVALGYKHNKAGMAEVARRCPWGSLEGPAGAIEARLRAAAAELPPASWRLKGVRPANHPWRRLSGMARFAAAALGEGLARGLAARRSIPEQVAWLDPDGTGLIGPERAWQIALNVFVPFLGEGAWREAADGPAPRGPAGVPRPAGGGRWTARRAFGALRALKRQAFSLAPLPGEC